MENQPNPASPPVRRAPRPMQARTQQQQPTTSYRNDPPPGMGAGEQGFAPQPYQAQPGQHAQHANTGFAQGQATPYYGPQAKPIQQINAKAWGGIGLGLLLVIGGVVATMISYDSAGAGGRYTIWWGPVVFGGISLIGGIAALFKK
jgi:hypothetical protein